jgi:hypothetical protein
LAPDDAPPVGAADEGGSASNALPEEGNGLTVGVGPVGAVDGDGSGDDGGPDGGDVTGGGGGEPAGGSTGGGALDEGESGANLLSSFCLSGWRSAVLLLPPGKGIGVVGDPPNPFVVDGSSGLGAIGFGAEGGGGTGGEPDGDAVGIIPGGRPDGAAGAGGVDDKGAVEDGGAPPEDFVSPPLLVGGSRGIPVEDSLSVVGLENPPGESG